MAVAVYEKPLAFSKPLRRKVALYGCRNRNWGEPMRLVALTALANLQLRSLMRDRGLSVTLGVLAGLGVMALLIGNRIAAMGGAAGLSIFGFVAWVNFSVICAAALFFFPRTIFGELEAGTMPLLQMTGLGAVGLLLGKGGVQLLVAALLLLVQLPFATLAVTLGGVSVGQVLAAFVLLSVWLLVAWSLALLVSTMARNSMLAAGWTFLALAVLSVWPSIWVALTGTLYFKGMSIVGRLTRCLGVGWTGEDAAGIVVHVSLAAVALIVAALRLWWVMAGRSEVVTNVKRSVASFRMKNVRADFPAMHFPALVSKDVLLVMGGARWRKYRSGYSAACAVIGTVLTMESPVGSLAAVAAVACIWVGLGGS
jgi:hypothetical protein